MLVENAQPMAVVEVGLVQSCKPLPRCRTQAHGMGDPASLAAQLLRFTVMTSWKKHALQQVTARCWTQAGRAGR